MKITFISNYMTHHQYPFCEAMHEILGDDFVFLATDKMEEQRIKMGWNDKYNMSYIRDYTDEDARLILESDIVLCGSVHVIYIKERLKADKITFRYFERLYKKGRIRALAPRGYLRKLSEHTSRRNKKTYLLCAGAFVPADFSMFFSYPGKMFKWGYFPEGETKSFDELMEIKKNNKVKQILWTGRMLDWKYPVMPVLLANMLRIKGFEFHIDMIGEGPERNNIEEYIEQFELKEYITLHDFMKPEEVKEFMQQADIYLMTSDYAEGWGVVVNEAMSEGCNIVASAGAGCSGYLIENEVNGLIYDTYNPEDLCHEVMKCFCKKEFAKTMARNAYETIRDVWSPKEAATRFCELSESLLKEDKIYFYDDGPLSEAEKIAPKDAYYRFTVPTM